MLFSSSHHLSLAHSGWGHTVGPGVGGAGFGVGFEVGMGLGGGVGLLGGKGTGPGLVLHSHWVQYHCKVSVQQAPPS